MTGEYIILLLIIRNLSCFKYRSDKQNTKKNEYSSWLFKLTGDNIKELCQYLKEGCNLIIALVCGVKSLKESQIALLDKDQIQEIINLNKTSITISRKNREKSFRVLIGGERENSIMVKTDRFKELF